MPLPRRFDDALMSPPDPGEAVDPALLATLQAWCEGGAFPALMEPLRVASIAPQAGLDGAACALDGSHELARLGRWRGLLWRLQLLLREARPDDPWDCGWWRAGALDAAQAFQPRRATLLMVREADAAAAAALLSALDAKRASFSRPVRVLLVSSTTLDGMARL